MRRCADLVEFCIPSIIFAANRSVISEQKLGTKHRRVPLLCQVVQRSESLVILVVRTGSQLQQSLRTDTHPTILSPLQRRIVHPLTLIASALPLTAAICTEVKDLLLRKSM